MTSMTTETLPARPPVGSLVSIRPDDSPLRYWDGHRLSVHSHYSGSFRPSAATVIRHDIGGGNATRNMRVSFTDPDGVTQEQWMDVTEIAQSGESAAIDYSTVDAATNELLATTALRRVGGTMARVGELRDGLREPFRAAVRNMVGQYRSGTRWGSEREAGREFWREAVLLARTSGGRPFSRDYANDEVASEQIGAWLHTTILPLIDGLRPVQTLNPWPLDEWALGAEGSNLVFVRREAERYLVRDAEGSESVSTEPPVTIRRVGNDEPLTVLIRYPDGLGAEEGQQVYAVRPYDTAAGRRTTLYVAREPNTPHGSHWGYISLRHMRAAVDPAPATPVEDPTVEVDGVKYVRLDVIEKDMDHMVSTLHQGAIDNGLCPVYDKTQREVDAGTSFIKMGSRYKNFSVVVEQTVTIRRTINVDNQATEEAASRAAIEQADAYRLTAPPSRLTGEVVRMHRHGSAVHISTAPRT